MNKGIPYLTSHLDDDMSIDFYVIDFDRTFDAACLLDVEEAIQWSDENDPTSQMEQACDEYGVPIWTVKLVAKKKSGRYEVIAVTLTSLDKPCGAVPMGTAVGVKGFEIGIMAQLGVHFDVYFTAQDIRPLQSSQFTQPGQATRIVSAQPLQPARATSGQ